MFFLDVNVCVAAMRPDSSADAERTRAWVEAALVAHEQVGISELVMSSMTRIVTNARIFHQPSSATDAMTFAEAMLTAPAAVVVRPGQRHWSIFSELMTTHRLRANDVPDAYLASIAMEAGATMVSLDRGLAKFEKLKRLNPLT